MGERSAKTSDATPVGENNVWVDIQLKTFTNWINEQLRSVGLHVSDFRTDFADGVKLVSLVEVLQKRKLKKIKSPINQHQAFENVQTALNALISANLKLVNIGSTDIVEGNLKLILGLIWQLIIHYQIGKSSVPPKKLMLVWLQAVLPELSVGNITTDFNSGKALSALIDYCRPGLFPNWRSIDPKDSLLNCEKAMRVAQNELNVPMILTPEDLSHPNLDERSSMTYLSYFMKESGPGYQATLLWVQSFLKELKITNFTTDWNDGVALCSLVTALGETVSGFPNINREKTHWESSLQQGITAAQRLGVEPVLKTKLMADPEVEHFGLMAYVAKFQFVQRRKPDPIRINIENAGNVSVNTQVHFSLKILDSSLKLEFIRAEVHGPSNQLVTCQITLTNLGGSGNFTPHETGLHELLIFHKNDVVAQPIQLKVHPDLSKVSFSGIDPCAIGSVVEVLINSNGAGEGHVGVDASSPSGQKLKCDVNEHDGHYMATFTPNELGEWKISVTYSNEHINGSPFVCWVFDVNEVKVLGIDYGVVGQETFFIVDASDAGLGLLDIKVDNFEGINLPVKVEEREKGIYFASLFAVNAGKHRAIIKYNGVPVNGSPFTLNIVNTENMLPEANRIKNLKPTPSPRATLHEVTEHQRQKLENITSLLAQSSPSQGATNGKDSSALESQKLFARSTWANEMAANGQANGPRPQKVMNHHRITTRGRGLKFVPVKRPVTFTISAPGFDPDDISITVTAPSSREIPTRMDTIRSGSYEVEYITPEVGEHLIEVTALAKPVTGSPFHSSAYDASKIKVGPMPSGLVGKSVEFEIDGSEAGSGNLEILVNGGRVTSEVQSLGNHRFLASFIPHTPTAHVVEMKFNDEPVPGSPWKCDIFPSGAQTSASVSAPSATPDAKVNMKKAILKVQTLDNFPVSHTHYFDVACVGYKKEELDITISGPSKIPVQLRIVDLQNDTFRVYFSVSVVGTYVFEVAPEGEPHAVNSSFTAKAYDISRIHVSDVPKNCLLGDKCEFQVDASQAGEGQLEIAVNDGEVPNQVQVQGNGKCTVSFKPETCISHVVDIKFNGQNVPGCPFTVDVSDATQFTVDLSQAELIPVEKCFRFQIQSKGGIQQDSIRVLINSPTGKQLPVQLIYGEGCSCEFSPIEVGPHVMTIEHCGRSISATPFFIKTYDAKKVIVTPTPYGCVGKPVQFVVDASNSGEGNLEIAVNAKGQNVMTQVHPMGGAKFGVSFTPNEVCEHLVSVTFNNEPVKGSAFSVMIGADLDKVTVSGSALHFAPVDQNALLTVHNIMSERDVFANIEGPNGQILVSTMSRDLQSNAINIEFLPLVPGEHHIHIHYKGSPLPGSPFSSKIYDIKKIRVKDMAKEIIIGKPVTFLVEAANAGPGNLEVIVNNGKVPSTPQALGPSLYAITFLPKDAETHNIDIKFNGELVPGAPFVCSVLDASKLTVLKEGLDRIPVEGTATFAVETKGTVFKEEALTILGPNHKPLKPIISGDPHTGYKVAFTPVEVGDHLIDIKVAGESVPICPFLVKVYDSKKVKISDITVGSIGKPVFFSIDASQAGAGNLEIIVSVNGRNVPNYVQSEGNAKFRVNFKPTEPSTHMVSVKFNGEPVPESPYMVSIVDSSLSIISGQSLRMASLTKQVEFSLENKNDVKECKVFVTSPSGKKITPNINKSGAFFNIHFAPTEVGPHQILVLLDGVALPGSPVSCNVYDVSKIKVSGLNYGLIGKAITFQVDASQAGEGTLELVVTTRKSSVRAEVLMRSRGMYDVTFIPQEKVSHYVNITFNEEDVPGSPFKIEVKEQQATNGSLSRSKPSDSKAKQNGEGTYKYSSALIGSSNQFTFDWSDQENKSVEVKVLGPGGTATPSVNRVENKKLIVEYTPREIGLHRIEAFIRGSLVTKKPFLVEVCDPSRVKLVNVQDGVIGREQTFKIDCTRAGRGDMSLSIKAGEKEVKSAIKEVSGGVYLVTYVPRLDLPHHIDVRYNGYHAPGCPQMVEIRDPTQSIIIHGPALKSCTPGHAATFLIETGGFASAKDFDVIVTDPSGSPLSVKCFQQKDGSLLAEFTPFLTGGHKIEVLYLDKPVSGSPFTSEAFDAAKVILQKIKSTNFSVNAKILFTLSRTEAGYAELDVTVTSPLGRHLPIEVKGTPDGEGELIEFIPTVPGKYKIAITFGGIEIPGSPLTFTAQEGNLPKVDGNGLFGGVINEPTAFVIDARGLFGKPEVKVDGPDSEPKCSIKEDNGFYSVTYVPQEVGVFDVRVLWSGRDVPGSPYHPHIIDLESVRAIGGWENLFDEKGKILLTLNEEKRISFDVTGAGSGKLRGEIKMPNGNAQEAVVEQTGPHKFRLSLTPKLEGEYQITLYFADIRLPKSPLIGYTNELTSGSECATVVLRGHGLAGARVGEETEFIIDGNEAGPGQPEITLTGVKADIPIKVTQMSQKVFKATYTPSIQGTYLLNVLWANKQVKGCPLKVSILPRCDSSRVVCTGDGLKGGAIGKEIKSFIDTKRAGPGELAAHCVGPHKVAYCELYDQLDGTFTLVIKPQEGGRHVLTIKYGGEHVPGSPFTVRIAGPPDASKVRVYGPGIEHGVLPLYQSRFICDTRGAGAGQLTVRIRGPKGAFRVEMQRESQKDRTILCKYDPTEPGDYRIEVKWSGEHVPGSPFTVMIFDTQEELNRFSSQTQSQIPSQAQSQGNNPQSPGAQANGNVPPNDYFGNGIQYSTGFGQLSWRGSTNEL